MSKKKKRHRTPHRNIKAKNRHHLCYIGRNWSNGYCKVLRDYWYMIIEIPRDTLHNYIHYGLYNIPPPRGMSAKNALLELRRLEKYGAISPDDDIERRLRVLIALFDCVEQPTADAFKKQLNIVRQFYLRPP